MREAARRIGVPESTYREWEYGRKIRGEPYVKIAKAFGITLSELFGEQVRDLNIDQRLNRIKQDIEIVQIELKKNQK